MRGRQFFILVPSVGTGLIRITEGGEVGFGLDGGVIGAREWLCGWVVGYGGDGSAALSSC
jgi:hypothetical protein